MVTLKVLILSCRLFVMVPVVVDKLTELYSFRTCTRYLSKRGGAKTINLI